MSGFEQLRGRRRALRAGFIGAVFVGLAPSLQALAQAQPNLQVQTDDGPIKGLAKNSVVEFLGIPYAAPPTGPLRWQPPQRHAPWTDIRDATAFGPTCAQNVTLGVFSGPVNNNEDCLYLNVYTPALSGAKLPVIVWIHGGGNVDGESNDYDGSKLATQGHTVVVTINYRLGILGWLAHPALDREGHLFANYGTLDNLAALQWVHRNIEKFGGDENNVTVAGQSAGSIDVEAMVASPMAAGLIHRAIFESGLMEPAPLAAAEERGVAFAAAAGCGAGGDSAVARCLRKHSARQIMALQGAANAEGGYTEGLIADGAILPEKGFLAAFEAGKFNHVPILSGTVHDEYNFIAAISEFYSKPPRTPISARDFDGYIATIFGSPAYPPGTVDKVRAHYKLDTYASPQLALDAVGTDSFYGLWPCGHLAINKTLAGRVPLYAYEFAEKAAPFYFPDMPGFQPLAYHTGDIQYLFPLYHGGPEGIPHELTGAQAALSDELVAAWTNFARTGNPNGAGDSPWPRFTTEADKPSLYLVETTPALTTMTAEAFSAEHQCGFWNSVLRY
jgi:para-nitrobenzyl esterase